jgi:hypothetical protein
MIQMNLYGLFIIFMSLLIFSVLVIIFLYEKVLQNLVGQKKSFANCLILVRYQYIYTLEYQVLLFNY